MCGIAGIVFRKKIKDEEKISLSFKKILAESLKHRGPDFFSSFHSSGIHLFHSRLKVIDLSDRSNQPIFNKEKTRVMVYNGEIYNYKSIQEKLSLIGYQSKSSIVPYANNLSSGESDTEVLFSAFNKLGFDCLPFLNGIFAFAFYNHSALEMWLVRDRIGIKPLYFSFSDSHLCFASEIKPLLILHGTTPPCDTNLLHEWLFYGNSLGGKTLFKNVVQLSPGHALRINLSTWELETKRYWSLQDQCRLGPPEERGKELAVAVHDRLNAAVQRQLVSDVPVGVFLSGGIDSSAIAAFAAKTLGPTLQTFCAGFDDPSFPDERPRARWLAQRLGTTHHDFLIRGEGLSETIEQLVDHHGGPFFDAANIPLWFMAREVSSKVKVVLQGDGGDELFGGYRRYATIRWHRLLRLLFGLICPALKLAPDSRFLQRARRYAYAFDQKDLSRTISLLLTAEESDSTLLNCFEKNLRSTIKSADPFAYYKTMANKFAGLDACRRMSMVDLSVVLPDIYLEKVDRATMAHGVEVRVPFLDNELVDYMVRLPGKLTMPFGQTKWLLKAALRGIVPSKILNGPKTGFNVPFSRWLRGPLRNHFCDHLEKFQQKYPGILNQKTIQDWIKYDVSGSSSYSTRLWKIYNLVIWANKFHVRFEF